MATDQRTDQTRLERAVSAMLCNAISFTTGGGEGVAFVFSRQFREVCRALEETRPDLVPEGFRSSALVTPVDGGGRG